MDLQITVYKTFSQLLDNKPCFCEAITDVPQDFDYTKLVLALKSVFGDRSVIQFL